MPRSAEFLVALVAGLDVRNNPLFWPGKLLDDSAEAAVNGSNEIAVFNGLACKVIRYTRCNGYAGVVFAALGCPVPVGMTANQLFVWFPDAGGGARAGWREVTLTEAIARANGGFPLAIVAHDMPHGHIACGVPGDGVQLYCSAAGSYNTSKQSVAAQFGRLAAGARCFTHD